MAPSKSNGSAAVSTQPKRPASAFMIFSKTFHQDYKSRNTDKYDVKAVAKLAGVAWGNLDANKKKKYSDEYAKLKVKYDRDMANYDGPIIKRKQKGGKKVKDPNAPKRPMSAYILFANDQRETVKRAMPTAGMKEITSELARRWRELGPGTKEKFDKLALAARAKYAKEIEKYNAKKGASPAKGRAAPAPAAGRGRKAAPVEEEEDDDEEEDDEDDEDEDDE